MPPIDPERNVGYTERDEDRAQQRLLAFLLDRAVAIADCHELAERLTAGRE